MEAYGIAVKIRYLGKELGVDQRLETRVPWKAERKRTMFTAREIIDLAVRIEKNGEQVYRKAAREAADPAVASMLGRLADDEAEHAKWFARRAEGMPDDPTVDEALQKMAGSIMEGILGDQSFSLQDADFSRVEQVDDLLRIAIEFEKDTVLFYELIGSLVSAPGDHLHLEAVILEERGHIRQLEELSAAPPL
jgi:rubrerythrin